jgi:hypothetical protein
MFSPYSYVRRLLLNTFIFLCYNGDMSKTLELAVAKAAAVPEAAQEQIAYELLERIDALSALRAAIDVGLAELDAGHGTPLDIDEVIREARADYASH